MNQEIICEIGAPASSVIPIVEDLTTYPHWIDIVHEVTPDGEEFGDKAYYVTLKARIGPISRSKKLRMVEDPSQPPADQTDENTTISYSRFEKHDRKVSQWSMKSIVSATGKETCRVTVYLRYRGEHWSGVLETLLESQTKDVSERLETYVKEQAARQTK